MVVGNNELLALLANLMADVQRTHDELTHITDELITEPIDDDE